MTTRFKITSLLMLVVLVVVGVAGMLAFNVGPEEELNAAETALRMAQSADADRYAPEPLHTAQSALMSAKAELQRQNQRPRLFRSYGEARTMLESATSAALEARERGAARQEQARAAQAALDLATIELENVRKSLKWVAESLGRSDLESMEEALNEQEGELQKANERFDNEDFVEAKNAATSVLRQCNEIAGKIRRST